MSGSLGMRSFKKPATLLACGMLVLAMMGQAPAAPSSTGQDAFVASTMQELESLMAMAPARQMGQAGAQAVDDLIRQRFEQAVARHADPAITAQAQPWLEEAHRKHNELNQLRNRLAVPSQEIQQIVSPFYLSLTVERPIFITLTAILIFIMAMTAYFVQRRPGLLWLAGVCLATAATLPIMARLIQTPYEQAVSQSLGQQADGNSLDRLAHDIYTLHHQAAQVLKPQWQTGRMTYPAAVFEPGPTTLHGSQASVRLYPLAPNLVEPANLPGLSFEGPIRYVGQATSGELAGVDLSGAVALMEFDTHKRWLDVVQLGAKVVVFIEPPDGQPTSNTQAVSKFTQAPLSLPRFYVKRADLETAYGPQWRQHLISAGTAKLTQSQPGRWSAQEAVIDWLYIPAAPKQPGQAGDWSTQLVHIQAHKDDASIVPELSPGATGAANVALLLQLLAHFEAHPPARPVLLSAITGHTQAMQGETEYAHWAFAQMPAVLEEQQQSELSLARQLFLSDLHDVSDKPLSDERIESMRLATPMVAGQVIKASQSILDTLRAMRNIVRQERHAAVLKHEQGPTSPSQTAWTPQEIQQHTAMLDQYDQQASHLVHYMRLFNRFGKRARYDELDDDQKAELSAIFQRIADHARQRAAHSQRAHQRITDNLALRRRLMGLHDVLPAPDAVQSRTWEALFQEMHQPLPATLVLNLDLTFDAHELGFFASVNLLHDRQPETDAIQRVSRLARHTLEVAEEHAHATGQPNLLQDTLRNVGGVPWSAYLGSPVLFGSRVYHGMGLPALTLATVRDGRLRAFTPSDTLDRLDRAHFEKVISFVGGYLPRLVDSRELDSARRRLGRSDYLAMELNLRKQDEFSVSVPQTPVADAQIVIWPKYNAIAGTQVMYGQVRSYPLLMTDARGIAMLRSGMWREGQASAYQYDEDYSRIVSSLDMGDGAKRFTALLKPTITTQYTSRTLVAFEAGKVDLVGLTEPLLLAPVSRLEVIDAFQDATPRHFGAVGIPSNSSVTAIPLTGDGVASVFMEPGSAFKLRTGQGLLINTSPDAVTGVGFGQETGLLADPTLRGAQDMWRLTDQRLNLLQSKGVSNDTAMAFNDEAHELIQQAIDLQAKGQGQIALVQAEQARGLAFRAYTRGLTTINDLIKAVVIFLALIIPFCFFLTKLISPYTDINRQIAMFAGVFILMALLLWLVHPAFKIASTPAVVILAFVILGLAVFVAMILMGRFNASMNQAVEEVLGSESADAPQGRLASVAFMVGINNMKRRRIRTTLTCVTIVLVTFTMLSVISVGQDVEPARVSVSPQTPYSGLLFTKPGLAAIDATQMRRLRAHFDAQGARTIARAWVQRKGTYGDYLPYLVRPMSPRPDAPSSAVEAKVIVGMEVQEDGFVGPMPMAIGGRWFSDNHAAEIILSVQAAALLGITPDNLDGQMLEIHGRPLKLVGLVQDERLTQMQDLGELPLTPLLTQAGQDVATQNEASDATGQEAIDAGGDLMGGPGIEPARPMDIAIVPLEVAREMDGAAFHTLSIKFSTPAGQADSASLAQASQLALDSARHFIRYQHARLYTGLEHAVTLPQTGRTLEAGQYSLTSSSSTQIGGILKVAIPIILAATIILNTMLGSVMERRREVAIYNAIGLNPGHVMVFFLAESLVFGMIGAVAGYLIGQILSMAITHFNIVSLNLNYSSLSVMVVIFLTIATVLLSTVYPAMMAARAAVPSGQRRWALPQPQGDEIHVQFPFCYDALRVKGVCAYLREFMHQNSEASTGQFLARAGAMGRVPSLQTSAEDGQGQDGDQGSHHHYAMIFHVSPAPFDLGVNQTMEVYAYYDPHVRAHMLSVYLTRLSGEASNWKTVNQPFLEGLRKRLLGWRSQRPETQQMYHRQGEQMFADAGVLPVMSPPSSSAVADDASQGDR